MSAFEDPIDRLARLIDVEKEYRVTILVLSVIIEQLLRTTGGQTVEITDQALADAPDLRAWRNPALCTVELTTSREG